jgi:hypothetical protein
LDYLESSFSDPVSRPEGCQGGGISEKYSKKGGNVEHKAGTIELSGRCARLAELGEHAADEPKP